MGVSVHDDLSNLSQTVSGSLRTLLTMRRKCRKNCNERVREDDDAVKLRVTDRILLEEHFESGE
jgi:hypothetical protein